MSVEPTNSKSIDIWKKVVEILTAAMAPTKPLSYVKELMQGARDDAPQLPAIIVEPINDKEVGYSVPLMKKMTLTLSISCWTDNYGTDKQIVGDDASVGVMDFARDVKNILNAFPDLSKSGNATMIRFPLTNYPAETWPNRVADITMEIDYLSTSVTR